MPAIERINTTIAARIAAALARCTSRIDAAVSRCALPEIGA